MLYVIIIEYILIRFILQQQSLQLLIKNFQVLYSLTPNKRKYQFYTA